MNSITNDIEETLYSEEEILKRVEEISMQISKDYEGKDLLIVGILKGSVIFTSDLAKHIKIPCSLDFMAVSSYGSSTESSGVIIIVEDIVDTGITLSYLLEYLNVRKAASIEIVALLNKKARRKADIKVKYIGFDIPDEFIVGYGMDYGEKYRNLPFIGILKREIYEK